MPRLRLPRTPQRLTTALSPVLARTGGLLRRGGRVTRTVASNARKVPVRSVASRVRVPARARPALSAAARVRPSWVRVPSWLRLPRVKMPRWARFSVRGKLWAISGVTVALSIAVAGVGWISLNQSNNAAATAIDKGARLEFLAEEIETTRMAMVATAGSIVNDVYQNGADVAATEGSSEYSRLATTLRGNTALAKSLTTDPALDPTFEVLGSGLLKLDQLFFQLSDAVRKRGDTEVGAEGTLRDAAAALGGYFQYDETSFAQARAAALAAETQAGGTEASTTGTTGTTDTMTTSGASGTADTATASGAASTTEGSASADTSFSSAEGFLRASAQEATMLALQRVRSSEKDFILRQSPAYATEVGDGVAVLKQRITELGLGAAEETEVLAAVDAYLTAFDAYASAISGVKSAQSAIASEMSTMASASSALSRFGTSAREAQITSLGESVDLAQKMLMGAAAGAFLIGAAGAIWLIRTIMPLKGVTDAALAISQGDLAQEVTHDSNDEIGDLAGAMRSTIVYLNDMAAAANRISEGDVSQEVAPRSERDVLGNAFSRMQNYLQDGVATASEIAQGNLTVSITPASDRDALGIALVEMRDAIHDALTEASRAAEALSQAKDELVRVSDDSARTTQDVARAADQVAAGTQEQAKGIDKVAENMMELSGAVTQVAHGAEEQRELLVEAANLSQQVAESAAGMSTDASEVASAASDASGVAKSGADRVNKTIDNIHRLKASIDSAGTAVSELGARSNEIGKIVGVIRDIAAQTDLLALNAAIEAARAGEHGAGFAVVADEVRSLAARATSATKDISQLVIVVQEGVERAVTAMNSGAADMQTGIGSASEAGEALATILESVEAVDERIRGIADRAVELRTSGERMVEQVQSVRQVADQNSAAAEGMRILSTGVEEAAGSIAAIAEENSASAEETSASAEAMSAQVEQIHASTVELGNMADALRATISRFRLGEETPSAVSDEFEEERLAA